MDQGDRQRPADHRLAPPPERPTKWDLEHPRWPPASAGKVVFGSWSAMLLAAGQAAYNQSWSREEVLAAIGAFNQEHGRAPSKVEWETTDASHPSSATVRRMFDGSFVAAVKAAGLQPAQRRFSDEQLPQAIRDWEATHSTPPRPTDWQKAAPPFPSQATVRKRFGSFGAAVRAAHQHAPTALG